MNFSLSVIFVSSSERSERVVKFYKTQFKKDVTIVWSFAEFS
jgi:hypothetical protein